MKYDVIIIGGGPAGYTAAEAAGKAGLSVVLFEKQSLGGGLNGKLLDKNKCNR